MAFSRLIWVLYLSMVALWAQTDPVLCGCFTSMFSFGDSIGDTGNTIHLGLKPATAKYPYGLTYFDAPTGRYCNGRIIIDFIAESQGFGHLHPYMAKRCGVSFEHGVNFAVAGASVLNISFYLDRNVSEPEDAKFSLLVQLGWFKEYLSSVCNSDCRDFLSTSLIFLGEMGGDDYIHPLQSKIPYEEIQTYVPLVVSNISQAVETLINLGAKTIVVPGIFPLGCSLQLLTYYETSDKHRYDPQTGCLIQINQLVEYHNDHLQKELERLRKFYTNVTIVYADYYKATLPFYLYPEQFGFNKKALLACCGDGGQYNVNLTSSCGPRVANICQEPSRYLVWDASHYTEKVYELVADAILSGEILSPPIDLSCLTSRQSPGYFDQK